MFRRRRVIQNRTIAKRMRRYFEDLSVQDRADPEMVARCYGKHWWDSWRNTLRDEKTLSQSRFHVGLSSDGSTREFIDLTKRAVLVTVKFPR